jgi:hypothetical protein
MPIALSGSLALSGSITGSNFRATTDIISPLVTFTNTVGSNGGEIRIAQTQYKNGNNIVFQYSQTTDSNATKDLGFRRNNTGSLEIYDGVTADGAIANRRDLILRNITGSNALFSGSVLISGSLTTTGTITAQTLVVQTISSSIEYASGSNIFGSNTGNTHQFTGSVLVSGSVSFGSSSISEGVQGVSSLSIIPSSSVSGGPLIQFSGNGRIRPASTGDRLSIDGNALYLNGTFSSTVAIATGGGNVGIGISSPSYRTHIAATGSSVFFGISNQGSATGDRQLRLGFGGNGSDTFASIQGTRLNVADDINIAMQSGGGNVGIGTTSPSDKLNVVVSSNGNAARFDGPTSGLIIQTNASTTDIISYGGSTPSYRTLNLSTSATTAMSIISGSGNVGIGTTNPTAQLQVSSTSGGLISINSTTTNTFRGITFQNNAASDSTEYAYIKYNATSGEMRYYANPAAFGGAATFYSNNAEAMRITSGGQVLIGQTAASGNSNGIYFRPGIESGFIVTSDVALQLSRLGTTGIIQTFYSGTTRVGQVSVTGTSISLESNSNGGLTVASTGYVGIGTTSPGAQLEVTSTTGGILRLKRDDTSVTTDESLGTLEFYTNDGDGPHIGAYVRGLGADLSGQNYGRFGALAFGVSKTANTDAVEAMRIDLSGNVGIGTTTPTAKLQVNAGSLSGTFGLDINVNSTFNFGSTNGKRTATITRDSGDKQGIQFGYDATDGTGIIAGATESVGTGIDFYTYNGSAWGNRLRITSGGNVNISNGTITTGVSISIAAINTAYVLKAGAYSGLVVIRDNTNGGSGVWIVDPNYGNIQIANNMPGTFTIAWNGTNTTITKTSGNAINISVGFYSNILG